MSAGSGWMVCSKGLNLGPFSAGRKGIGRVGAGRQVERQVEGCEGR